MAKKILITGATGLVGTRLTELLKTQGHQIVCLTRKRKEQVVGIFEWDIVQGTIDTGCLAGVDTIVHLAGAGIADKPWTSDRKKEILESRIKSTQLLFELLQNTSHQVRTVVAASAIGYYGFAGEERIFDEESSPGNDFLADVVKQWEAAIDRIAALHIRVVKLRIGIVFSEKGGALAAMVKPIKWGLAAPLGSGDQYLSWIHLDDLCRMFVHAIDREDMNGAYNAVALQPVTNKALTQAIAKVLKRPLWLPAVPGFVLQWMLGEMAGLVLNGSQVSARKIVQTGFSFSYPGLQEALQNLLGGSRHRGF